MRLILVSVCLLSWQKAVTQSKNWDFFPDHFSADDIGLFFSLTGQNSLHNNGVFSLTGFRTGVTFNGVHKIGFGYNTTFLPELFEANPSFDDLPYQLKFQNIDLMYQRFIYKGIIWEWTLPCLIGLGKGQRILKTPLEPIRENEKRILVARVEVQNRIFIYPWAALKWAVGYRLALSNSAVWQDVLNVPYVNYGISFYPWRCYKKWKAGELWQSNLKKKN